MSHGFSRHAAANQSTWARRPVRTAFALAFAGTLLGVSSCTSGAGVDAPAQADDLFTSPGTEDNAPPSPGGAVVAELELDVPTRSSFVLHGTIPVPPGTYPRPDGLEPFSIRNSDGMVVPTQVEIVSRYAADADGADVIEVLGRVDLPGGAKPGERVSYQVVEDPHPKGLLPVSDTLLQLLLKEDNVRLVADDVFGNTYEVDVFHNLRAYNNTKLSKLLRRGDAAVQLRTYDVMKSDYNIPSGAPSGKLDHLFGVHAYTTIWSGEDAINLDLRVVNGFDGHDTYTSDDDPIGKVYFKSLELVIPPQWALVLDVEDPTVGDPFKAADGTHYPLIAANGDGTMHVMHHQAQFNRRLALALKGDETTAYSLAYNEGQAFCKKGFAPGGAELYSWWNSNTARYFPQRHKLPDLSFLGTSGIAGKLSSDYYMARTALETGNPGNYAVPSPAHGYTHPWGVKYGGMTGGIEINLYDGLELAQAGNNRGWKFYQFAHRMVMDRQMTTLYSRWGEPTSIEDWVIDGSFKHINFDFWLRLLGSNDPFGFYKAPSYQINHVATAGMAPGYEWGIGGYEPIDFQHYIRLTRVPKILSWLGNDALAKDDLKHAAEIARMSWHEYPKANGKTASGSGLYGQQSFVQSHPNHGIAFGRGQAWSLDAVVAAYSVQDQAYRAQVKPWLEQTADVVAQGQASCSGFIQAINNKWLNYQFRSRSSVEQAITENALWGLKEAAFRGADSARLAQTEDVLVKSTQAMIGPMAWVPGWNAPWFLLAVTPKDLSQPAYCGTLPQGGSGNGPDEFQTWSSFAYGYELTGDPIFLQRAQEMSFSNDLLAAIMNDGLDNMVNKAALLAILQ